MKGRVKSRVMDVAAAKETTIAFYKEEQLLWHACLDVNNMLGKQGTPFDAIEVAESPSGQLLVELSEDGKKAKPKLCDMRTFLCAGG